MDKLVNCTAMVYKGYPHLLQSYDSSRLSQTLPCFLNHCMRLTLDMQQKMLIGHKVHATAGVSGFRLKR